MLIEKKNVAELLPADYNPRKDLKPGDKEYEKLKRSIEQFWLCRACHLECQHFPCCWRSPETKSPHRHGHH